MQLTPSLEEYGSLEEIRNNYRRLIEHNGGWAVIGSNRKCALQTTHLFAYFSFTIIATATEEEARVDAAFLGMPPMHHKYYYKFKVNTW